MPFMRQRTPLEPMSLVNEQARRAAAAKNAQGTGPFSSHQFPPLLAGVFVSFQGTTFSGRLCPFVRAS